MLPYAPLGVHPKGDFENFSVAMMAQAVERFAGLKTDAQSKSWWPSCCCHSPLADVMRAAVEAQEVLEYKVQWLLELGGMNTVIDAIVGLFEGEGAPEQGP